MADTLRHYPGTPQHQAIMRAVVDRYENDQRILAVAVFGSLGRGNWDEYSDIDLDVVIADEVSLNAVEELTRLCQTSESLLQMSVRYHPLATTHPNIVDTLHVLTGRIDHSVIAAAGTANRRPRRPVEETLAECVRYAAVADIALQRRRLWDAVEMLHRLRHSLMELFTLTHGGQRSWQFFQANADPDLQAQLGHTLPQYSLVSVQAALERCFDILEHDLGPLTNEQLQLPAAYREVLKAVRHKQAQLRFGN
ncbi:MAG: nucleotidyltransferase domain-containing protein [Chloroflexi bacterium]|nr:nucleotidyltransferase domain-containing protein [Chloroflexota bacterium]